MRIRYQNGDIYTGVVAELPNVQIFEDGTGTEGINAMVRLEDPDVPRWNVYLWLDEIDDVESMMDVR